MSSKLSFLVVVLVLFFSRVEMISPSSRIVVLAACETPLSGNTTFTPVITADGNNWDVYGDPFFTTNPYSSLATLGPVSCVGNNTLFYVTQGTGPFLQDNVHIFPQVIGYDMKNPDNVVNVTLDREEKNDFLTTYCILYHPSGVLMALTESGYGLINYETRTLTLLNKIAQGNKFGFGANKCAFDGTTFYTQVQDGLGEYAAQCGGNQVCMLSVDPLTGNILDVFPEGTSTNNYISTLPLPSEQETTFSVAYDYFERKGSFTGTITPSNPNRTEVGKTFQGSDIEFHAIDVTDGPLGQFYYLRNYQFNPHTFVQLDMETGKQLFQSPLDLSNTLPSSSCRIPNDNEVFDIIAIQE